MNTNLRAHHVRPYTKSRFWNKPIIQYIGNPRKGECKIKQEKAIKARNTLFHNIPPVFDEHCHTLILGSFPSVASRDVCFFYGHPRNRFWQVISAVFDAPIPDSMEAKKALLLGHGLALWDVVARCEITGSGDASIRGALPNDLNPLLCAAPIGRVFTNGAAAHKLYRRFCLEQTGLPDIPLPSTSPANASFSLPRLMEAWRQIKPAGSHN